jgi:hypothetical protein
LLKKFRFHASSEGLSGSQSHHVFLETTFPLTNMVSRFGRRLGLVVNLNDLTEANMVAEKMQLAKITRQKVKFSFPKPAGVPKWMHKIMSIPGVENVTFMSRYEMWIQHGGLFEPSYLKPRVMRIVRDKFAAGKQIVEVPYKKPMPAFPVELVNRINAAIDKWVEDERFKPAQLLVMPKEGKNS